jgi:hypothetical protein
MSHQTRWFRSPPRSCRSSNTAEPRAHGRQHATSGRCPSVRPFPRAQLVGTGMEGASRVTPVSASSPVVLVGCRRERRRDPHRRARARQRRSTISTTWSSSSASVGLRTLKADYIRHWRARGQGRRRPRGRSVVRHVGVSSRIGQNDARRVRHAVAGELQLRGLDPRLRGKRIARDDVFHRFHIREVRVRRPRRTKLA